MQLYKEILTKIIALQSISTDAAFKPEINKTASALEALFLEHNFTVQTFTNYGNPIVVATYNVSSAAETALVYGHYDVQPASKEEGWNSDPFTLTERDGRLYGRGVVDNKGQFIVHMATIFTLIASSNLKHNITFVIEGEEEIGSRNFEQFLRENIQLVTADFCLLSDGETVNDMPAMDASFRGIVNIALTVQTAQKDLHSGLFGGSVPNAALELSKILTTLTDNEGVIQDKRFYEGVIQPSEHIIANNAQVIALSGDPTAVSTTKKLHGLMGHDYITRRAMYPSFEITTLKAGYAGEGFRNAVPHTATAKINVRLAPNQKPNTVFNNVQAMVAEVTPNYVESNLHMEAGSTGVILNIERPGYKAMHALLSDVYGVTAVYNYNGAIIPLVGLLDSILNIPVYSVGLANEDCNMHAVDENFRIDLLKKGLEFSKRFFST